MVSVVGYGSIGRPYVSGYISILNTIRGTER
jgi:hypothetical protein